VGESSQIGNRLMVTNARESRKNNQKVQFKATESRQNYGEPWRAGKSQGEQATGKESR
jgi:hypothetical protein